MKKLTVLLLTLVISLLANSQAPVKVSCIGDSITYGFRLEDPAAQSYPAQLQELLGAGYCVGNFGKSGATLLRRGHRPYMEQDEFRQALDFAGDIIVIHLGINDTDPRNWPNYGDEFVGDYLALIDSLKSRSPEARILVARMTPIGQSHPRFLSGTLCWHKKIQEAIGTVARVSGAQLIDFYEPLISRPDLLPDAVHPNVEGAGILAQTVFSAITGDYGGLSVSDWYTDNMVLPRNRKFEIRGKADAGEAVSIALCGRKYKASAGSDGRWSVTAGPFPATESTTLGIETKTRKLIFRNVAIGEIWLCSGQSNMEFELGRSNTASDAGNAADPGLRLYDSKCLWRTDDIAWPAAAVDSIQRLQYFRKAEWTPVTSHTALSFSAIGYYFGKTLRDSLKVPVGLICNAVGGSTQEAWIDRNTLEDNYPLILRDWLDSDYIMPWARGRAARNISSVPGARRHPYEPAYLFESAILPMDHYPISGIIWYQGESNAHNIEVFEELFPLFVDSWRAYFGKDTPVYYVQLSSIERPSWPAFRDAQRRLENCRPGLVMAVSSDLGNPYDVHPGAKKPIGERLARLALNKTYGLPVVCTGPRPLSVEKAACGKIAVRFDRAVHAPGSKPVGFEVLDDSDGLFHAVDAVVKGDRVILKTNALKSPSAVRYAWQPYTEANLSGPEGLPVSTFRL